MPVLKGNLKEADRTKIQMNYIYLKIELDGKFLVDDMFAEGVFTFDDKEEILNQDTREKRTEKFLEKLWHSGPETAYDVFLRALQKHYPHVAARLKEKVCADGEEFNKERRKRKQSIQGEATLKTMKYTNCSPEIFNQMSRHDNKCDRDHTSFIPVWAFKFEHLPEEFRFQEVYDYIRSLGDQTVFVDGGLVSHGRRDAYFLSDERGMKSKKQRGSGRIRAVVRKFEISDGIYCPCNTCIGTGSREKQWGAYLITCPMHVIFNEEECKSATFCIDYNHETNRETCLKLCGGSVISSNMSLNISEILCYSHDSETCKVVEDICDRNDMLRAKLSAKSHFMENGEKIAVLVSHPHGEPKHISIGQWVVGNDNLPHSSYAHAYTTAACPVSAGGPVLLLGDTLPCITMHRRAVPQDGVNQSNGKIWSL